MTTERTDPVPPTWDPEEWWQHVAVCPDCNQWWDPGARQRRIERLAPPTRAELVAELRALLEAAEDMRGYVSDYFAEKWEHDQSLERARAFLARVVVS